MNRIGIAAVTYKENFGSALQTYATQYVLENLGYDARIFEIKGVHRSIHIKKLVYYLGRMFDPVEFKYLMANLKSRSRKSASVSSDQYAHNMLVRKQVYTEFNKKWNKMLPTTHSWKELGKQASEMDAVVVGSDQLWRPSNIVGCFYTLEFVPDNVKKIAFSTSFGVPELPMQLHKHAKKFLSRIEHISVRENTGADIVKSISGKKATVVCDPTMLLTSEDWMHIQDKKPFAEGKYILCYFMGDNPEHREFVKKLKEKTGCRIIGLLHGASYISSDEEFADEKPYNVGPSEFINLIRNAEYICTDSFHGIVFCILNQKKFFSFRRWPDESKFSANDRLYTLLDFTGLSRRMLNGNEDVDKCIEDSINYSEVLEKVSEKRKMSMEYLVTALKS
ncbi:MAG: polysaccharide pyruvyl transferase family protein [Parabacteroides sp.]|nr:polysaccharide pyruvyl transferase family protein [Parabacteroides sp.]